MATQSARDKMLQAAKDAGWLPDPSKKIKVRSGAYDVAKRSHTMVNAQDPFAFFKPAAHGGTWRIYLDYKNRSGWGSVTTGNTLKEVKVDYYDALGERTEFDGAMPGYHVRANIGILAPERNWRYSSVFFDFLGEDEDGLPFPKRAVKLIKNIDLGVWLYIEAVYKKSLVDAETRRKAQERMNAQDQPLPITIEDGKHGYGSQFKILARNVHWATQTLESANGTSDLPLLLAETQAKLNAIIEVLTPEAHAAFTDLVAGGPTRKRDIA